MTNNTEKLTKEEYKSRKTFTYEWFSHARTTQLLNRLGKDVYDPEVLFWLVCALIAKVDNPLFSTEILLDIVQDQLIEKQKKQ